MTPSSPARPAELRLAADWAAKHLDSSGPAVPFSLTYGGRSSGDLLSQWQRRETIKQLDRRRVQRVVTFTDPRTALVVRCVAVTYRDFPVVEWTVHLKNAGKRNTPIIANLQAVDMRINLGAKPRLHYHIGSPTTAEDYRPLVAELKPGAAKTIATSGGRPCNAHMPFFNLEGKGGGLIVAVGWPGQWAAEFRRARNGALRIRAGQELTHFTLHPGEEVRTPLIALLFYQGDRIRSQNLWRRWMIAHNLPRPHGKLPAPMLAAMAWLYFAPWGTGNAQAMKVFIDTYQARQLPIDAWWTDAGWYDCDGSIPQCGYSVWTHTGTWAPDRRRFPNGVREVNDHAHRAGLKTILWFEPERVARGSWLDRQHPDWLLAPPRQDAGYQTTRLLDLGNPAARRWVIQHVSRLLERQRVDVYREDFNLDPLPYWRTHDTQNRQGLTEIRHVTGHLAFWDALRRRRPGLLIDVCASGGKRNELEALRRAVPLWRSDYVAGISLTEASTARLAANQCITYSLASWIPYFGTGLNTIDAYRFRSFLSPSLGFDLDPRRDDLDVDLWRKLMAQFKQVAPYYFGDYYPLTPYRLEPDVWMAWQFDCPEKGGGLVQAFRRETCPSATVVINLRALQSDAIYEVADLDDGKSRRVSGRTLMAKGLQVETRTKPAAIILTYQRC